VWGRGSPASIGRLLTDYADRRERGEPPAYILGGVSFMGAWVKVGPGAFVPRPWTEAVARAALELLGAAGNVVDLCAGAGPIAMAIATASAASQVWATEIDPGALRWAHANLDSLSNVTVLEGDLFEPLPSGLRGQFDVVVGCLPYVPTAATAVMPRDFRDYEPLVAFDGGPDGLSVVSRVVDQAAAWLRPGGWIVLEIGAGQGERAVELCRGAGYNKVVVRRDEDGDDAMIVARRQA
jgi:release factor glutamine methyltransferase